MTYKYDCWICDEVWEVEEKLPIAICPLCSMSFFQMIHDTLKTGGIRETFFYIFKRVRYFIKGL